MKIVCLVLILSACGQQAQPQTVIEPDPAAIFHDDPILKKDCQSQGGYFGSFTGPTCSLYGAFCMKKVDGGYTLNDRLYAQGSCVADMIAPLFKQDQSLTVPGAGQAAFE